VLNSPKDLATDLAQALLDVKERVGLCTRCCNLTQNELCDICAAPKREQHTICVVESTPDLRAIESTGEYRGTYHVLHGLIRPLEGVGPDDVHIRELLLRLQDRAAPVQEIILATSPSVDGEATALYLSKLIKPLDVRVTRIASGIPIGGDLEYTDRVTLSRAMTQRREI
jgi:recombination protein RecR